WWGKTHSNQWYEQVVDCMGALLDNDTNEEVEQQSKIVRYCIAFEARTMISERFELPEKISLVREYSAPLVVDSLDSLDSTG
ncbi:MAG: hypothetical protein ACRCZI_06015, partial [Cetobacterium sp.]